MKILLVGGAAQGKLAYAVERYDVTTEQIWYAGEVCQEAWDKAVLNHLHLLVRRMDADVILSRLNELKDWLVICDEVGCGVVPTDAADRRWRESVGRLCCALAQRADVVERVVCGLAQRIKG